MPKIIDRIPSKRARVEKLEGKVHFNDAGIRVGEIELPDHLLGKFLRRCEGYDTLQDAVNEKEMYVRGKPEQKPGQGKTYWFGLVSDQFRPVPVKAVSEALGRVSSDCTVRYLSKDRFQLHYEVPGNSGMVSVFMDSGEYGLYGGNGENAIKLGVAVTQGGNVATINYGENNSRVIHRITNDKIDEVVAGLNEFAAQVPERREQSKSIVLGRAEVEVYLTAHARQYGGVNVVRSVLSGMNGSVTAYDLSTMVSREAQNLESVKLRMERLAGDIMFSPERVVKYGSE